jgi:signal transduction histidine kinase/DNA-binding NarL/FixJ family response regulator
VTSAFLAEAVADPSHLQMLAELAPRSAMFVPLIVRAQVMGAVTLVSSESGRRFAPHDLWLASELARRAALAIENARLYQHARAATRAREEVLAVVAHDLRNPLSAVAMISSLLLEECLTPEQAREQLLAMLRSTEEMDRLIEDLLDVARIDSGTLAVDPSPTALGSLIPDVLQQVELAARKKDVRIEVDLEPDLPAARADAARVVQVLSNLLSNAVRHSPPARSVTVRAARLGRELLLSVTDEGDGIAPEHMVHLFDRFWQAHPRSRAGAGLGLSIARGIVEAHGGRIWASSAPGQGAIFFFTLPLAEEIRPENAPGRERASVPVEAVEPPADHPIRVLLVDDHPALRRGVRSMLERARDLEVVGEAGTAEEGIALAERLRPDVVLMDLGLPGTSGVDAIRLLTARNPAIRVLALTADAEEESVLAVLEAGGHGFVQKESAHAELVTAIRTAARDEVFLHARGNRVLLDSMRRAAAARESDPLAILSEQERRILTLVAEGFNAAEIGKRLFLSPSTVASYRSRAMRSLGLHDRASLVHLILELGLLKVS